MYYQVRRRWLLSDVCSAIWTCFLPLVVKPLAQTLVYVSNGFWNRTEVTNVVAERVAAGKCVGFVKGLDADLADGQAP